MDSTVIQEIANQLGMAVDQAGQFVTEQLPAFAGLKILQCIMPCVVCVLFLIALIPLSLALFKKAKKQRDDDNASGKNQKWLSQKNGYSDYPIFWIAAFAAFFAVVSAVCFIGYATDAAYQIIGWSNYPEAMIIDMALKAVG